MRILHLSKKYLDALGGDTVVVANLQAQQEAAGHQVAILTSNCAEIRDGPRIYKFGLKDTPSALDQITWRRLLSLVALFFKSFWVIWRERPDVIHTHSIDMAFVISPVARLFRVPLVHTFHIVTFYDKNQSKLRRVSELWLARHAHPQVITAPNAYDVRRLNEAGLKQAVVLPNGVDLEFWQADAAPTTSQRKEFLFVSVGRLEEQKGYRYLIEAAARLAKTAADFKIVVVGEGGQLKILQRLTRKHGLVDTMQFVGRKSPSQVRQILSQADAVVFPSLYETTPLTLLEAWAAQRPVIMTAVGILREMQVNRRVAYIVPPCDADALAAAMQSCMTSADVRATVAANGFHEVNKYAWSDIAQLTDKLYGSNL